ncbi:pilus assembly protein PilM [Thiotrichales bacterium 19S9-12]|nr:pilus assembly protein PilM [Thiotrichales bacterium 19S9-11]MCF6811240.1 pilus assembly protein PilM [Thiotrichales bacterium 19S9-12]
MNWLINTNKKAKDFTSRISRSFSFNQSRFQSALQLTNNALRLVTVKLKSNGSYKLVDAVSINLSQPAFNGDRFYNIDYLSSQLTNLMLQLHYKPQAISIALDVNCSMSHLIPIDQKLDEQLIESHVIKTIEQYFPYQLDQIYYDYQLVDSISLSGSKELLLVASQKELVNQYKNLLQMADLELNTVDIYHYALYRLLDQSIWQSKDDIATFVVEINYEEAIITLLSHNQIPSFCERLKYQSFDIEALIPWLQRVIGNASQGFLKNTEKRQILLCGEVDGLNELKKSLNEHLNDNLKLFNPFKYLNIQLEKGMKITNPYQYLIPLGLVLRKE